MAVVEMGKRRLAEAAHVHNPGCKLEDLMNMSESQLAELLAIVDSETLSDLLEELRESTPLSDDAGQLLTHRRRARTTRR